MGADDQQILTDLLEARHAFGHRQHVELAWRYLQRHPFTDAAVAMTDAIRHVARLHGAEQKYNETLTRAWLHLVAVHDQRWPADDFEAFADGNDALLDSGLIWHFYTRELALGEIARSDFTDPDVRPLPALA